MSWIYTYLTSRSTSNPYGLRVRNLSRVAPGRIYRGARPDPKVVPELRGAFQCKSVVCLELPGPNVDEERAAVEAAGLLWRPLPISDKETPPADFAARWLQIATDQALWPIFVHCAGGRHRTGLAVAIYRVAVERWAKDAAWAEAKERGFYAALDHGALERYFFALSIGARP
jgi:protein tyrosine/serine phosphatase